MKHLETSIPGMFLVVAAVVLLLKGGENSWTLAGMAFTTGVGLLRASDASKVASKDDVKRDE